MFFSEDFFDEALALTKKLVAIPSLNGTEGERVVAEHIADWLRALPYFSAHPDQVIVKPLKGDPLGRINVVALACGTKGGGKQTVIIHGHHDTVGIDDFGPIRDYAFDCDALPEKIRALTDDPEVLADIDSGDWLFGRGAGDMKGGVVLAMLILKQFTEQLDRFDGNLIFMSNPVEENQHTGVIESLDILEALQKNLGLTYKLAMNTDPLPPLFPGDTKRYFYAGSGGKILPSFYIVGKPTHVGQCFDGLSASMVAAEIVRRMELSSDFISSYKGEYTLPPAVLKIKDLKAAYDVQTAVAAFVYFNLFVYDMEMTEVFEKLRRVAGEALDAAVQYTADAYQAYCKATGSEALRNIDFPRTILDYSQLYDMGKAMDPDIDAVIDRITAQELARGTDRREISLKIVQELASRANINTPTVIVFLAPPYLPRNVLHENIPEEAQVRQRVLRVVEETASDLGEHVHVFSINPYPTDSSYLKADDSEASLQTVVRNFPNMDAIYPVPVEQIKRMNIPAFGFPGASKDPHKWTERLHLDFTFRKMPVIIWRTLEQELN